MIMGTKRGVQAFVNLGEQEHAMTSTSDPAKPAPGPTDDTEKPSAADRRGGAHDRHKIEKIAKAGRRDFDPNEENEG